MLSTAQKSEVEVNSEFCISRRERVPATEDFFFFLKKCAFLRQRDESAPLLKKKKNFLQRHPPPSYHFFFYFCCSFLYSPLSPLVARLFGLTLVSELTFPAAMLESTPTKT